MYGFVCFVLFVCFVFAGFFKKRGGVISYMYVIAIHVREKMGTGGVFKFCFSFLFFVFVLFVLFCFVSFCFVYFFYFLVLINRNGKRGGG